MVERAGVAQARNILELGPGTGPFTEVIDQLMPRSARYLGLELNPVFAERLRAKHPQMQFVTTAAQDFDYASFLNEGELFDTIVSGLPWTAFPESLQIAILDHALGRLRPGGTLVTFAYLGFHLLPKGRHFRSLLESRLGSVECGQTVWRNLPPAFVYAGIKPD
jgi:phosphatidylethanolamine/phosphatidyl-N-methylethanolamine N-methyltransferase